MPAILRDDFNGLVANASGHTFYKGAFVMAAILDLMGALLLVSGAAFLLFGGLGLVRMPDVFNRIQAGTKTTTLGTLLILAGSACLHPEWGLKLLLIGLFLLFTNPLSSQVLARAAHRSGAEQSQKTTIDRLAEDFPDALADHAVIKSALAKSAQRKKR